MKILVSEKLSEHKYKTPEGYLICTDAILARTGKQTYTKDEVFGNGDNTEIDVDRPYEQVMNEKTIASFENKPVTFDHPEEDVNVGNYKDYAVGYVRDVHQGKVNGQDVILGNLVITNQDAIDAIESGEHTDLSCGYDCDIKDDGSGYYSQNNIRGNHVALCREGRAGMAKIIDSNERFVDQRVKDAEWSNDWASLDELGIDDRDKKAVEAYFKKLASKYGVSYVRTVYGIYPSPIFRGDRKKLEKLILKEYAGGSKSDAEEEYEFIEDSIKNKDMAQRVFKFSTNIPALKRAISNRDKEEVESMLTTLKKDKEDFERWDEQGQMSNFDKKTFEKTMSEVMSGIKKMGLTIDSKKQTSFDDALKILNVVKSIKAKDTCIDAWVIKNTGLAYEVWNKGRMIKSFATKRDAIYWIESRFPGDRIVVK